MGDEKLSSDTSDKLSIAGKLHFFVIFLSVLMAMLDRGSLYRFFAYLNLVVVLVFFIKNYKELNYFRDRKLLYIFFIPFAFIALHLFAVLNLNYTKAVSYTHLDVYKRQGHIMDDISLYA